MCDRQFITSKLEDMKDILERLLMLLQPLHEISTVRLDHTFSPKSFRTSKHNYCASHFHFDLLKQFNCKG